MNDERIGPAMSAVGDAVSVSLALDPILVCDISTDGAQFEPVEGNFKLYLMVMFPRRPALKT